MLKNIISLLDMHVNHILAIIHCYVLTLDLYLKLLNKLKALI